MSTASLSAPFLIDGISYTKVLVALVLTSCIMPIIIIQLLRIVSLRIILGLFLFLILINFFLLELNKNSYRSVFGAPGRSNGFLSGIVCFYFFVVGIYLNKFYSIVHLYKTISFVSVYTSLCIIVMTEFRIGNNSILASNNFLSRNFAENSNLISPLMTVGFISTIVCFRKTKNYLFLVFLVPITLVAIKLSVIQVYLVLGISLFIFLISTSKRHFKTSWLPAMIFLGYFLGLSLALLGFFDRDSSIKERSDILREGLKIASEFTLLPQNIDGLSDFTENFVSFYGTQFLDDFHNVFLQIMFSYGLVIGLLFLLLSVSPFLMKSLPYRDNLEFLSVYTSLLVSLLIGISSPNYIYIHFMLLGYSSAHLLKVSETKTLVKSKHTPVIWFLAVLLVVSPVYVQLKDLETRFRISDRAIKVKALNLFTESNFNMLIIMLSEIEDAGYRNTMALNFYSIGECTYGDLVYSMMSKTNPHEARIRRLNQIKNSCQET